MTTRPAISDVQPKELLSQQGKLPTGESWLEANSLWALGEAQGNDILLQSVMTRYGGGRRGIWQVDNICALRTVFVAVPQDQRGKLDVGFICNREFPTEWSGDVQILEERDQVIWQVGKRQHICHPPYWEIKGEHMGVDCNLTLGGLGKTARWFGPFDLVAKTGQGGYEQPCWVEGTITVGGKTYTIEKGYGTNEKMILGKFWDLARVFEGNPYYYIWLFGESVRIFLFTVPGVITFTEVFVDGQEVPFGLSKITLDEQNRWVDPKTLMQVPTRWHLNMSSENGVADVIISTEARGFYGMLTRTGLSMHYMYVCRTEGRFSFPDGRSIPMNDILSFVEMGWTALPMEPGVPAELPLEASAE